MGAIDSEGSLDSEGPEGSRGPVGSSGLLGSEFTALGCSVLVSGVAFGPDVTFSFAGAVGPLEVDAPRDGAAGTARVVFFSRCALSQVFGFLLARPAQSDCRDDRLLDRLDGDRAACVFPSRGRRAAACEASTLRPTLDAPDRIRTTAAIRIGDAAKRRTWRSI